MNTLFQKLGVVVDILTYQKLPGLLNRIMKKASTNTYWAQFDFSKKDIETHAHFLKNSKEKPITIKSINWFIPYSYSPPAGGRMIIFRVANALQKIGVKNHFIITGRMSTSIRRYHKLLNRFMPWITRSDIFIEDYSLNDIPFSDVSVATRWDSAFSLLRFNKTNRKAYFIQDFEPDLYPAGEISALAKYTYTFGFYGIVNSPQLFKEYQKYSSKVMLFPPSVDHNIYSPYQGIPIKNKKVRIIFYARPHHPRNGFQLGIEALKKIKEKYGTSIEIFTVGSEWNESYYGLHGILKNLGRFKDTRKLAITYQDGDIGMAFVFSKGFPLITCEMMASGLAMVTNENSANKVLFNHKENCLLSPPTPSYVADSISTLIENYNLRRSIALAGISYTNEYDSEENLIQKMLTFLST